MQAGRKCEPPQQRGHADSSDQLLRGQGERAHFEQPSDQVKDQAKDPQRRGASALSSQGWRLCESPLDGHLLHTDAQSDRNGGAGRRPEREVGVAQLAVAEHADQSRTPE
jgi:hypothetical protein